MDTTQNNGQEDGDLSQEPYPSPRFFIEPGEQVQLEALNIGLKKFKFHAYLTDRRIFLIDVVEKKIKAIAKEIPLDTIAGCIVEISDNQDPVLVLSLRQEDDEIKTLKIAFIQGGADRSAEIDTWVDMIGGQGTAPRPSPAVQPAPPAAQPPQEYVPEPEPAVVPEPEYEPEPEPEYAPEEEYVPEPEPQPVPPAVPKKRQVVISKSPPGARSHGAWPPMPRQTEPSAAKAPKTQPVARPAAQTGMQRPAAAPVAGRTAQPTPGVPRPAARIPQYSPPVKPGDVSRPPEPPAPARKPDVPTPMKTAMKTAMQPLRQPGLQPIRQPAVKPLKDVPPPPPPSRHAEYEEEEEVEEREEYTDTIFCYNCGRKVLRIANFCPECGTPQTHPKEKPSRHTAQRQNPAKSRPASRPVPQKEPEYYPEEEEPAETETPQRKSPQSHKKPQKKQDATILHKFLKR